MRKVIGGSLMSLNGVIGNPHVWASEYFDQDAAARALEGLRRSHAMLMGRTTYEIFSRLWPNGSGEYVDELNRMRKYVFSSTLETADWTNTEIVRGDVVEAVTQLKQDGDDDLVVYGHGPLGQALLDHGLMDELHVAVHPLFVGEGTLMFRDGATSRLELVGTSTAETGVVLLSYRPFRD
jgi:dihydrofolate reductase